MNRRVVRTASLMVLVIGCYVMGTILYLGYRFFVGPPRDIRCTPISYPVGDKIISKSYAVRRYETNDSIEEVKIFFEQHLSMSSSFDEGKWTVVPFGENVLYECQSPLNKYEIERGCIYVSKVDEKTAIESVWQYSESGVQDCQYSLPDIPYQ